MNTANPQIKLAYTAMVGDIVSAYVSNNHVASADLPALIAIVHAAMSKLSTVGTAVSVAEPELEKQSAAQIRKSIRPEGLVSFIDGRSYKTLKRHLTKHGLAPDTYRAKFGLPPDYPMVAASYSEKRSSLAKSIGLGVQNGRRADNDSAAAAPKGRKKAA